MLGEFFAFFSPFQSNERASTKAAVGPPTDTIAMAEATTGDPQIPTTADSDTPKVVIKKVYICPRFILT